jgi:hypothetical protein
LQLKERMDTLDKNAVRDNKLDFEVLSQDELDRKLSKGTKYEKKYLLLTQIGYLRINLFQEHYERIQEAQESQDFDKAVHLMNQYIQTIALPYIQERLHPSLLTRLSNLFSTSTLPDAAQTLQEWQTLYKTWKRKEKPEPNAKAKTKEDFDHMKNRFITLYTLSFSTRNFPPVVTEPAH